MGSWNYGGSKYITIGIKLYDYEELENMGIGEYDDPYYWDYENTQTITKKYKFKHLNVTLQAGYYEGFYLDIEFDYCYFYNCYDKQEALKEATQLKKMLKELVDIGLCSVTCGWCSGYADYEDSIKAINKGIQELKQDIQKTPLEKKYYMEVA